MNQALAVETFGLTKQFKTALAVDRIDLQVPKGVICGFLGKNGAGKTTTIKMLTGLLRASSGEFAVMGEKKEFGKAIEGVGYLPDVPGFYGYMTGREFLMLCAKLCGMTADEQKAHSDELLRQVGLFGVKTKIGGYSRGMRQRLGIAQALINSPPVVFMDEPISALDPMGRRDVMGIIGGLKGKNTVILSTHILSDVENICDYIAIIHNGKIVAQDYLVNLKKRYSDHDVAKINFYDEQSCDKFAEAMQTGISTRVDALQISIQIESDDFAGVSKRVAGALAEAAVPFKSFNIDTPSLDDIFHEVTANE